MSSTSKHESRTLGDKAISADARSPEPRGRVAINGVLAIFFLYLFLCALKIMGTGLKGIDDDPVAHERIHNFFEQTSNPFIMLVAAVFITAVVQSSSFTTTLIITLVAAGQLDIETGVYAIMGANIGTSVTSTIAALGSVRIKKQFRRAFSAAIVHDFFNLLAVATFFPIEWITQAVFGKGIIAWVTEILASNMGFQSGGQGADPVKLITKPFVGAAKWLAHDLLGLQPVAAGVLMAVLGIALLLISLALMVANLKGALLKRIEGLFSKVFFRNDLIAYFTGMGVTILVQSSSVTTSLIVPLAGAGTVKLKRVFPYVLGANLGTTFTGLLAATANPNLPAVSVALAHVVFNIAGAVVWYPLRKVPIRLAKRYASLAAERKRFAAFYLIILFAVIPMIALLFAFI